MHETERDRRLFAPGPKRILALDGGGVRGIVSLAFLERIEEILSLRAGRATVLADYFDLIGGTSTGAILATGLSLGMSVEALIAVYLSLSHAAFRGWRFHGGVLFPKFRRAPLYAEIHRQVGHETLGSAKLRTGLAIVAKRIDTGSVWVFHNNPRGPYFDPPLRRESSTPNKDLRLNRLLRASTAAPTFFAPERLEVAPGLVGTFVDGGVSPHNNPALLMFMLATINGYGFRWPVGTDKVLLTSVGTGHIPLTGQAMPGRFAFSAALAVHALRSVIDDCSFLGQTMLQWFGATPTPTTINSEIGDLSGDQLGAHSLFRYLRYNIEVSADWIGEKLRRPLTPRELKELKQMDQPESIPLLLELSRLAARQQISPEHFPAVFDRFADAG